MSPADHAAYEAAASAAENLCREERWTEALDQYTKLVHKIVVRLRDPIEAEAFTAADAVITERLAQLSVLCGFRNAAADLLAALHTLYTQAGNSLGADRIMLQRLHLEISAGQLSRALKSLEGLQGTAGPFDQIEFSPASLARWESACGWHPETATDRGCLFAQFYLQAGRLLAAHGQYRQALESFARGCYHANDQGSSAPHAALSLRVEHAAALVEFGDLNEARTVLQKLKGSFPAAQHPGAEARVFELSGQIHLLRGELGLALFEFNQVTALCARLGLDRAMAVAQLNLAQICIFLNRTSDARALLMEVVRVAERFADDSLGARAAHLIVLAAARSGARDGVREAPALVELWQSQPSPPQDNLKRAHRVLDLPQSGNFLEFFEDRALGFHSLLDAGDFATAHRWLEGMQTVFTGSDSQLIRLRLAVLAALDAYFNGFYADSAKQCAALRPELERLGLKRDQWQIARLARWCNAKLSETPSAENPELAAEAGRLLAEIADSLPRGHRAVFLLNKATDEEEGLECRVDELVQAKNAARRLVGPRRWLARLRLTRQLHTLLLNLDAQRDSLVDRRIESNPRVPKAARSSLWKALLLHPLRRATISFLVLPDRVLAARTGWMQFDFCVRALPRVGLYETIAEYHGRMAKESTAAIAGDVATRLSLDMGFAELINSLPWWTRALTVVPDGILHAFPFAVVLRQAQKPRDYTLTIGFRRTRATRRCAGANRATLVVASSDGWENLPPLPHASLEARSIAGWLASLDVPAQSLLDGDATKKAVLTELSKAGFAHVACHGEFNSDDIDKTGFALIPLPGKRELVTLRELARLDLSGLNHITLSACSLADSYILPGRWVISLPETLWRAGARSILASLWRVDDAVAAAFMRYFYEQACKFSGDEALRRTQIACLSRRLPGAEDRQTEDPYFWAGFTLFGAVPGRMPV